MVFEIERQHRVQLGEDMRRATENGIARINFMEDSQRTAERRMREFAEPIYDFSLKPSLKSVPRRENLASDHCKKIVAEIREFEAGLDEQHEIGVKMINFGSAAFHPTHIKFLDPDLIVFCGKTETGDAFEVMQHASQINLLLVKMKRDTTAPKTPIGFSSEANRD